MILVDISHQDQVDNSGVFAFGIIIDDIGLFQIAQPGQDAFDNLIEAHDLADHGFQFREKRVLVVCDVIYISSVFFRG